MLPASRLTPRLSAALPHLAHFVIVSWLFAATLFLGRVHFARDMSIVYFPDYVFLERSLARGVWPLWNPSSDGGAPFFMPYPVVTLLVWTFGARGALALGPPLHILLAMCGTTLLARERGSGALGGWAAGAVLGLSGLILSTLLFPGFLAAAWAPFVLLAWERLHKQTTARNAAGLALALALQVSTLGGEVLAQTLLLAAVLRPPRPTLRRLSSLLLAATLACLLAAPVLLGARSLLEGTARGRGFSAVEALGFSAPPVALMDAVLPRFFGDTHKFSDYGFWGQPFFPNGYPFVLSLYVGVPTLLLASLSGRHRLWLIVVLGLLLSLGEHGPLAGLLTTLLRSFRVPVKFFFLSAFALALLAGRGVDQAISERFRPSPALLLPALLLVGLAGFAAWNPAGLQFALGGWLPAITDWRARLVIESQWPSALAVTGSVTLATALVLAGPSWLRRLAPVLAVLDLLIVNSALNPTAGREFYELRAPTRRVVEDAEREGRYRWFSGGLAATPAVRFDPSVALRNRDESLYAMERQALLPRMHVLDGLEGALDEDRTGLLPETAQLPVSLRSTSQLARYRGRLRAANIKWVIAWRPLPIEGFSLRASVRHPEILEPMLVYELRDALPRAYWVGKAEVVPDRAARMARLEEVGFDPSHIALLSNWPPALPNAAEVTVSNVAYESRDAHTVQISGDSPPGFLVVLDGFHRDWHAQGDRGAVPILEAQGGYRAVATAGGPFRIVMRYRPSWLGPALFLFLLGASLTVVISWPRNCLPAAGRLSRRSEGTHRQRD